MNHNRRRPMVELLEERVVLKISRFVIDFTPDRGSRQQFPGSTRSGFVEVFQNAVGNGASPRYLDFDGNGVVDAGNDLVQAADTVTGLVVDYFRPFLSQNVQIVGQDIVQDTNLGRRELQRGLRSRSLQTFVMYVGGSASDDGVYGESYQAAVGFNNEDFGRTYTTAIARMFNREKSNADPMDFAHFVASTVAHEFGHMLGLGHPVPDYANPLNVMDSGSEGKGDSFLDQNFTADLFRSPASSKTTPRSQNAFQEVVASLAGQRNENGGIAGRFRRTDAVFIQGL